MTISNGSTRDSDSVDFVSAMMHELKTSLTAIIASAELIADELGLEDGSVHWKLVQSIIRNAHRLNERVTAFAQMPRPQMQGFQFRPERVEVPQLIRNVVTRIHPEIQGRKQSLTQNVPDSLRPIMADRQQLEQVLLMLLTNASSFSPEGGDITVSAWQSDGESLVTCVGDSCGGIPAEEQERIFQPHYQIGRKEGKGGLGLTIAKFLVELHGGKIWLESRPGQGCSFFFSLPY